MKRVIRFLIAIIALVSLASCTTGGTKVTSIEISGQKTEFVAGDNYEQNNLVIVAKFSDGSSLDITDQAEISGEVDVNTPGVYAVIISYNGLSAAYQVNVLPRENVKTLVNIAVEAESSKKVYALGEELSLVNVVVYAEYANSEAANSYELVSDLSSYKVEVLNAEGEVVEGPFAETGAYTVVISQGQISDSYAINVKESLYESALEALEIGIANDHLVNGGYVKIDNSYFATEHNYDFGLEYTRIYDGEYYSHYSILEGELFTLRTDTTSHTEYTSYQPNYDVALGYMDGVSFDAALGIYDGVYGVPALFNYLSELSHAEGTFNYKELIYEKCEICGHQICMSFVYISEGYYYTYTTISFSLSEEETIEAYEIRRYGYYTENMTYDEETGEYTPNPDAEYDFNIVINGSQNIGPRTIENNFPAADLLYSSFELQDAEGNIVENGGELTAKAQEELLLSIVNPEPLTANSLVDEIQVRVTDENGAEVWTAYGSCYEGVISFVSYKIGTYNLVISSKNVSYTYSVEVSYADITEFAAQSTELQGYTNVDIELGTIVNAGANPNFTATVDSENASISGNYFNATVAGTYEVTLTSVENPELTATVTVVVEELPELKDVLNGKWEYNSMWDEVEIEFTPESEGALNGTLSMVANGTAYSFTYTCDPDFGLLELTPAEGQPECGYTIAINLINALELEYYGMVIGELSRPAQVGESSNGLSGVYTGEAVDGNGYNASQSLTFNADGTGEFSLNSGSSVGSFTYVVEGNNVIISNAIDSWGDSWAITATLSDNAIEINAVYSYDNSVVACTVSKEVVSLTGTFSGVAVDGNGYPANQVLEFKEDGTGTFSFNDQSSEGSFTYVVEGNNVVISNATDSWGDSWSITATLLGNAIEINAVYSYDNSVVACSLVNPELEAPALQGTFSGEGLDGNGYPANQTLEFNGDGTGTFSFNDQNSEGSFTYVVEGNNVVISNATDSWGDSWAITCTINGDDLEINAVYSYDNSVVEATLKPIAK